VQLQFVGECDLNCDSRRCQVVLVHQKRGGHDLSLRRLGSGVQSRGDGVLLGGRHPAASVGLSHLHQLHHLVGSGGRSPRDETDLAHS